MLDAAGWAVQDAGLVNLAASRGVAVREFVMKPPHGRADYLLFLDGRAAGVVEAKKEGEPLIGVEHQTAKYVGGLPEVLEPAADGGLAFVYESTGTETRFTNRLDPTDEPAGVLVPPAGDADQLVGGRPPPPGRSDAAPPPPCHDGVKGDWTVASAVPGDHES
jgi:type I site-specific restriction endonuclease